MEKNGLFLKNTWTQNELNMNWTKPKIWATITHNHELKISKNMSQIHELNWTERKWSAISFIFSHLWSSWILAPKKERCFHLIFYLVEGKILCLLAKCFSGSDLILWRIISFSFIKLNMKNAYYCEKYYNLYCTLWKRYIDLLQLCTKVFVSYITSHE